MVAFGVHGVENRMEVVALEDFSLGKGCPTYTPQAEYLG